MLPDVMKYAVDVECETCPITTIYKDVAAE